MHKMKPTLSAGIIPVYRNKENISILLLRAYKNWDFPKGEVNFDEDPFEAAQRELREETLISKIQFSWGKIFCETARYSRGKISRYYLAECSDQNVELPISSELGRPEHHEYQWVSLDLARKMVSPRLLPILDWLEKIIK